MEFRLCQTCRALRHSGTLCQGCGGSISLADESLFLGETFGKYRIDAVLGAGGMGVVYRATHATLQRAAALKIVLPRGDKHDFERRFLREARVLAELKHPGIVEIYDFDLAPWGTPYYVMECLEGATLRRVLQACGSLLPLETLAAVLGDIAPALQYAHRRGIVHRDLKPDNLFVAGFDGRAVVKVLDFGIAKLVAREGDERSTELTASGTVVGTPNYLAPEQILAREVGPATDQYALALIVAEAVSGRAVRAGKTLGEILSAEIQRPLDPERLPAAVPAAVRSALVRATQPDPSARFPDVAAFVAALELPEVSDGPRRLAEAVGHLEAPPAPAGTGTVDVGRVATPVSTPVERTGTVLQSPVLVAKTRTSPPPADAAVAAHGRRPYVAVALLAVAALTGLALWRGRAPRAPAPAPTVATEAQGLLQLVSSSNVAPDVTGILTLLDDTLVLEGGGALYLQPLGGEAAGTRIALNPGELVLGASALGEVFLLHERKLLRLDPLKQARTPLAEGVPEFLPPDNENPLRQRLRVSPHGRYLVAVQAERVEVCELRGAIAKRLFSVPREAGRSVALALGDEHLVLALGQQELVAFALPDGGKLWSRPLQETKVLDVALLEDAGRVALGGWFDHVDVHSLADGAVQVLRRQGRVQRLAWVADHPTLLLAGDGGLSHWRVGESEQAFLTEAQRGSSLLVSGSTLAALDVGAHRLRLYDYAALAPLERVALSKQALWCLAADAQGTQLYAGGQDGLLYRYDVARRAAESFKLHTDGVTDLALLGTHLASTSDDKTLAIWELPRMNVVWRSQAHGFLINQLHLRQEPLALWSSSSDGTLKRWGWPQPDALESVDTQPLFERRLALHAVWASAAGDALLAGTWQHDLLVLKRGPKGAWTGRALPVESRVLYQRAELPGLQAVVFVGLQPSGAYVYDLEREELLRLPAFGLEPFAVRAGTAPGEAFVLGAGCVLRYVLARAPDGALSYSATSRFDTRLGSMQAAALVPGEKPRLAAGTDSGELLLLDPAVLQGPPLASGTLRRGRDD